MENETSVRRPKKLDSKSNLMLALGAVVVILIVVALANFGGSIFNFQKTLSPEEAKAKALDFINKNLVSGTTATITNVTDFNSSLYKLDVQVGTNNIESYITKDGKVFYPQGMNMDDLAANTGTDNGSASATPVVPANVKKSDKPKVEVFVMSHCPYGTQMEKGMLPVMQTLGNKADFEIKFVNYVMHGDKELKDNINQYCIGTEQKDTYDEFLTCFLKSGDSASCIDSSGVNKSKLESCYNATDKKFNLTADFNDKTKWNGSFPTFTIHDKENKDYGVQGSPTLVINGEQVETSRDSASLLATVCAAFNNAPEECGAKLATATPSAGFGEGTAASGSAAECAPVQ